MNKTERYWEGTLEEFCRLSPHPLWRAHCDAVNTALLKRWLPENCGQRLLKTDLFEEALGQGLYPYLISKTNSVTGIDISSVAIRGARAHYPQLTAIKANVRFLPFADSTFEGVISFSTLDHFPSRNDLLASLCELHRVLQPGGLLIMTLDNPINPFVALRQALPFALLNQIRIVPYYTGKTLSPRALRKTLGEIGFDVQEVDASLHCPRVLVIPLTKFVENYGSAANQKRCLQFLDSWESLKSLPIRFVTGHFVAVRAKKAKPCLAPLQGNSRSALT